MKTLGVDLAAAAKKTAVAVIEWGQGSAQLVHVALDVADEEIVKLFGAAEMMGIDCPVGWPEALIPFLTGHLNFDAGPVLSCHTTASQAGACWPTGTRTALSPPGHA